MQQTQAECLPQSGGCHTIAIYPDYDAAAADEEAEAAEAFEEASAGGGVGGGGSASPRLHAAAGMATTTSNREALEVLRQCQRRVSGCLADVVGLADVKRAVREAVLLPMRLPQLFRGIRRPPRTFLLYGPPGTGKTLLVERIAAEAELTLLAVSPSAVLSRWSGQAEKTLRAVFEVARAMQPAAIFLDELDSLAASRGGGGGGGGDCGDASSRRLLTELLIQMNAVADAADSQVYVFAATNRIQDCDPAVLRRFDRRIRIPLPDAPARRAFFRQLLARPEIDAALSPADLEELVAASDGYSGSDLAAVCREAAMEPVRELLATLMPLDDDDGDGYDDVLNCDAAAAEPPPCKRARLAPNHQKLSRHLSDADGDGSPSGTAAAAAGGGSGDDGSGPCSAAAAVCCSSSLDAAAAARPLSLRKLVKADFVDALSRIRPPTVDQERETIRQPQSAAAMVP